MKPYIVLDTNVLVSSLFVLGSNPNKAFIKAITEYQLLFSKATFFELETTFKKNKISKKIGVNKITNYLSIVANISVTIESVFSFDECRDPDDNKFLDLAMSGNAEAIVSGDKALLDLNPFQGIPIINATDFISLF